MVSRLFTAVSMLAVTILVTPPAVAQESLAWKFQPGESLKYKVVQDTKMYMNLNGQQQTVTMNQTTMDMVWNVNTVESGGDAKMAQIVERVQFVSEGGPLGKITFDSGSTEPVESQLGKAMADVFQKIVGQEFGVTMQSTGKVQDVTVPKSLLKALTDSGPVGSQMTEDTLKQMLTQSAVILPADPIAKGFSWQSNQKVELAFGIMTVTSILTYEGDENGQARISVQPAIDVKPKAGSPITLTMKKSEGKGTVLFDIARGRIAKSDLELTMDLRVKHLDTVVDQTVKTTTSMLLAE